MSKPSRPESAVYRLYVAIGVLLLMQVLTVALVDRRESTIREEYEGKFRLWASRDSRYDDLGILLSKTAAPANQSFTSADPRKELADLHRTAAELRHGLDEAEADLRKFPTADSAPLLHQLTAARAAFEQAIAESDELIQRVARGDLVGATTHMSTRQEGLARVRRHLTAIRAAVRKAQADALVSQGQMHEDLERKSYVLFALIGLVIVGTVTWGQRIMRALIAAQRRERLMRDLQRSEERFMLAARATHDMIWDCDLETRIVWRCHVPGDLWEGLASSAFDVWESRLHPDDLEPTRAGMRQALESGADIWEGEYRMRRSDGRYAIVHDRGCIIRENGVPKRVIGAAADVTKQRDSERALALVSRQNELILQSAAEGIFGIDVDGNAMFVNESAAAMLGWSVDEMRGRNMHSLTHHTRADGSEYAWADSPAHRALIDGTPTANGAEVFWRRDGSSFCVEYACRPMRDEQGVIAGAVVTFRDVTARRAIETMKDEFISVVSHELRTPLTSIRGALGLLAAGRMADPDKARRMLEIAVSNTDRLVRLINDILDIERLESGRVSLQCQNVVAGDLVTQAVEIVRPLAEQAGIDLVARTSGDTLYADPDRVVQTLTNLVSNAVKFSDSGTTVTISAVAAGDEVRFEVLDEGRGIPRDNLQSIFERFHQVDASDSRLKGGTGLGLAICRSIVTQHGGTIWVESEPGTGSRFAFTIPRSVAAESVA